VICNEPAPTQGKGYLARQLGVPVVSDAQFMDYVRAVIGGTSMEDFVDVSTVDDQLALF
jgi:DNA polymerase III subunit epsilon